MLWFESDWHFCNITMSGWFWKQLSRKKVLNNHFLKSLQYQPYPGVLQNRCFEKCSNIHRKISKLESLFNKVTGVMARCFNTGVFLWILRTFYKKLFWKKTSGGICQSSLLNQKQCGMVSIKKCRSVHSARYLH